MNYRYLLLAILFLFVACQPQEIPERTWVDISQPQCSETPWDNPSEAVEFFEDHGVSVAEIRTESRIVCQACGCPPSEKIEISVEESDQDRVSELIGVYVEPHEDEGPT